MDDLERDLTALAPIVDEAVAREVFDTHRTSRRRRRRAVTGVVGALAVVGLVGGIATLAQDDDEPLDVGGTGEPGPVQFEVLDEIEPRDDLRRLTLIADHDQLAVLTEVPAASDVDFSEQYAVAVTMVIDGCGASLRLDRTGTAILPVVEYAPNVGCGPADPVGQTFVIAVRRSGGGGLMEVPAAEPLGLPAATLQLPSQIDFEVLAMEAVEPMATLRAATDADELAELWTAVGLDGAPEVDFEERLVVSVTIPDGACPPTLAGFHRSGEVSHAVLTPVFAEPLGGCDAPLVPKTFVVAIDRAAVLDGSEGDNCCFTLRLPASEPFHDEATLTVEVGTDVPPAFQPEEVTFEVLAMGEATDPMGTVRAATTEADYRSIWATSLLGGEPPSVDHDEQVVVSITIPDDACPPELTGFFRDGDTIAPVFVEVVAACRQPLVPKTYLVALDRAPLEPGFTLLVPGQDQYGFGDSSTVVRLAGPPPTPTCAALEAFDEQLDSLGAAADFSPTPSPRALLEPDLVIAIRGRLTGGSTTAQLEGDTWSQAIELEAVDLVYSPPTVSIILPERLVVELDIGPDGVPASPVPAGTEVLVVNRAEGGHWAPFGIRPADEGFAFACDGGPLLGRVGTQGEWAEIDSLDELADALRG